jgi:hypothetical protein
MTPEERFERIERNLDRMGERLDRHTEFVARSLQQQNEQIEKNTAGIRDLIVVSRTVLTSIQEIGQAHEKHYGEMRKAQAATDEELRILIDTVDRVIGNRDGNRQQ